MKLLVARRGNDTHRSVFTDRPTSGEASVLVTLETMEEPMPIVSPTSAQEATILNSGPAEFALGRRPNAGGVPAGGTAVACS